MPLLKGAWKSAPEFKINLSAEIFLCFKCGNNIEAESYEDLRLNIGKINSEYSSWFNWYVKGKCDPQIIPFNSSTVCDK